MPSYKYIGTVVEALPIIRDAWSKPHISENAYERYTTPGFYVKPGGIINPPNVMVELIEMGRIDTMNIDYQGNTIEARVYGREMRIELDWPIYQEEFFVNKEEDFLLASKKINKLLKRLKKAGSEEVAYQLTQAFDSKFDGCINAWGDDSKNNYKKRIVAFQKELYRTLPNLVKVKNTIESN